MGKLAGSQRKWMGYEKPTGVSANRFGQKDPVESEKIKQKGGKGDDADGNVFVTPLFPDSGAL